MGIFDEILAKAFEARAERESRIAEYRAKKQTLQPQAPPRSFSFIAKISTLLNSEPLHAGLFLWSISLLVSLLLLRKHWAFEAFNASGEWRITTAKVDKIEPRRSMNKSRDTVYDYTCAYMVEGSPYSHVNTHRQPINKSIGDTFTFEYHSSAPQDVYPPGQRPSGFATFLYISLGFGGLISIFVLFALGQTLRRLRLYQDGIFTRGKMLSSEPTKTITNKYRVWKYEFAFQTPDGKEWRIKTSTHLRGNVEDEAEEFILYDAKNPKHAIVYDAVPQAPYLLVADGSLRPRFHFFGFLLLLLPLAALLAGFLIPI